MNLVQPIVILVSEDLSKMGLEEGLVGVKKTFAEIMQFEVKELFDDVVVFDLSERIFFRELLGELLELH